MGDNRVSVSNRGVGGVGASSLHGGRDLMDRRARLFGSAVRGGVGVTSCGTAERRIRVTTGGTSVRSFVVALPGKCSAGMNRLNSLLSSNRGRHVNLTETFLYGSPVVVLSRPADGLSDLGRNGVLGSVGRTGRNGDVILISREGSATGVTSRTCAICENELS